MAKYTTQVRTICESYAGYDERVGYSNIDAVISGSVSKVFDFDFPIFDENYRLTLETKILKHYYTREIAAETVGLWKLWLNTRLNEIMPYYNKLYESELLKFDPFYDVDITRDHIGTGNTDSTEGIKRTENSNNVRTDNLANSNTRTTTDGGTQTEGGSDIKKNTRWDIYSDTPQGALTNVENETYLTNARKIVDDGTGSNYTNTTTFGKTVNEVGSGTQTGTVTNQGSASENVDSDRVINTTDQYLEHIKGKNGGVSYSKLLLEFRDTFLNIDMKIINELRDLFFNLW